jgi:flagellar basal-body rod protein FlgB
VFNDVTSVALHSALNGLALRQRTIADNVSNLQTPRFLAGRVQFEDALRSAVASGNPADVNVTATTARSLEPTREDGNNVNLDRETLLGSQTDLQYQLALKALDGKWSLLRTAIKG